MSSSQTIFIGIDLSVPKRDIAYAILDRDLYPIEKGVGDLDQVINSIRKRQEVVVGVNAPPRLNQGIMADPEKRARLNLPSRRGRLGDLRVAEYELIQRGFPIYRTPSVEKKIKPWMKTGFALYEQLSALGFVSSSERPGERQIMEVSPEICYSVWLGGIPLPQDTLRGRLQRQLVLYELGMEIPDPMLFFEEVTRFKILRGVLQEEEIYSFPELQSLAIAYTAWAATQRPGEVSFVGDKAEGQIAVPTRSFRDEN